MAVPAEDAAFYLALVEDDPEELYENAPCAYISTLPDGTIAKVNATFVTWTGHAREDVLGRRLQDLLAPGDRIFYETHFAPSLRLQGRVREIAVEVVRADGVRLPVLVNAVLRADADGEPSVVRVALFDARERRAYERELLAARQQAEAAEARARALASTLQATLLPPEAPAVPGLDVAGGYRPAGDGSEVGGDFFDVFETGRGSWGLVLGDVCGKGAAAAALTAVTRYTVRAEAARSSSPARVLDATHEVLLRHGDDRFCTAVLVTVARQGDRWEARVSLGGHPPPILARASGEIAEIGEPGSLLGMVPTNRHADVVEQLVPGDRLVLYTDGVTEARAGDDLFGWPRLVGLLAATAGSTARATVDRIVGEAVSVQDGVPRDDIAVLALRVPEPASR